MTTLPPLDVNGNCLELTGPINPNAELLEILQTAIRQNENINEVKFLGIDFVAVNKEAKFASCLEQFMTDRKLHRSVVSFCSGPFSDSFIKGILSCPRLELYGVDADLLQRVGLALGENTSRVQTLKLRARLDGKKVIPFAEGLKTSHCLEELYLTCEFNDEESVLKLADGLKQNKFLTELSFYSCQMFDESSTEILIKSLEEHPNLSYLELRDNSCFGMPAVASLVANTKRLRSLHLYNPPDTTEHVDSPRIDAKALSLALEENKSLQTIALTSNGLQTDVGKWLAKALTVNDTLRTLNLQGNLIPDDGIKHLGEALPKMRGLKKLSLWNNPFTGVGARALLAGLKPNLVLEEITTFSRFRCAGEMQFYTHLNKAGRRILQEGNNVPLSLWPLILGRIDEQPWDSSEKTSVLYTLLREGPVLTAC